MRSSFCVLSRFSVVFLLLVSAVFASERHTFDPESLAGTHTVRGRNPNGSAYEGKVDVRVKNGLVLMQWKIGEREIFGTGIVVGMTLGVALQGGVAIYGAVPQSEGMSLVGLWSSEGSDQASEETIFVGNADITDAQFEVTAFNGTYHAVSEDSEDRQNEERIVIAGGDAVKTLTVGRGERVQKAEGLALGEGLAAITPTGLLVIQSAVDAQGERKLSGEMVDGEGRKTAVSLVPAD